MSPAASTRWCPTPEQVMILEEMYKGGVRTPNAAQIQQITAHLSLYGKIEGKNVFYWFQNHKARDRQKLRKRLLAKQVVLHQHHQPAPNHNHMIFHHHHHLPNIDHHPFQPPHFLRQLHLDPPPPPPRYAPPSFALHYPPHPTSPAAFAAPQAGAEDMDAFPRVTTTSYTWTAMETRDANYGRMMMLGDDLDYDDDHDVGPTTRPLKTLELFPIKEKISLKDNY